MQSSMSLAAVRRTVSGLESAWTRVTWQAGRNMSRDQSERKTCHPARSRSIASFLRDIGLGGAVLPILAASHLEPNIPKDEKRCHSGLQHAQCHSASTHLHAVDVPLIRPSPDECHPTCHATPGPRCCSRCLKTSLLIYLAAAKQHVSGLNRRLPRGRLT